MTCQLTLRASDKETLRLASKATDYVPLGTTRQFGKEIVDPDGSVQTTLTLIFDRQNWRPADFDYWYRRMRSKRLTLLGVRERAV